MQCIALILSQDQLPPDEKSGHRGTPTVEGSKNQLPIFQALYRCGNTYPAPMTLKDIFRGPLTMYIWIYYLNCHIIWLWLKYVCFPRPIPGLIPLLGDCLPNCGTHLQGILIFNLFYTMYYLIRKTYNYIFLLSDTLLHPDALVERKHYFYSNQGSEQSCPSFWEIMALGWAGHLWDNPRHPARPDWYTFVWNNDGGNKEQEHLVVCYSGPIIGPLFGYTTSSCSVGIYCSLRWRGHQDDDWQAVLLDDRQAV